MVIVDGDKTEGPFYIRNIWENELNFGVANESYEIADIIGIIELKKRVTIVPGETLLILDEIQESPRALTSLKFLQGEGNAGLAIAHVGFGLAAVSI